MHCIGTQTLLMSILCLAAPSAIQDAKVTPVLTRVWLGTGQGSGNAHSRVCAGCLVQQAQA
jgi:hypothetical protein